MSQPGSLPVITTHESIGDPLAWMTAEASSIPSEPAIITAPDLDVYIGPAAAAAIVIERASPILGDLYVCRNAFHMVGDKEYAVEWYSSPTAANALGERMGLEPGRDFPQFVHSPYDLIPLAAYRKHLKRNEYPQSLGSLNRFAHDRRDDHAIITLLGGPELRRHAHNLAALPLSRLAPGLVVNSFDKATAHAARIAREIWPAVVAGEDHFTADPQAYPYTKATEQAGRLGALMWGKGGDVFKDKATRNQALTDLLFERLVVLRPVITRLQAEEHEHHRAA